MSQTTPSGVRSGEPIPMVLPAPREAPPLPIEPPPLSVLPIPKVETLRQIERPSQPARSHWLVRTLSFLVGWSWRLIAGAAFCFNIVLATLVVAIIQQSGPIPLGWGYFLIFVGFLGAIVAVGWTYRWMQGVVLRGWWRVSPRRRDSNFRAFCDSLGPKGPTPRPRWFLRERIRAYLQKPRSGGRRPGFFTKAFRLTTVPWHSLWLNFKTGVQGLFCTYLFTGWGCLVMLVSWEFGWLNSFHKGYEQAALGFVSGLIGTLLLVAAMFYVPMAQAHQAATGQARAFFDFRFIWSLVRARLTGYVILAISIWWASLFLTIIRCATLADGFPANDAPTALEGLAWFKNYLFLWSLYFLFPVWLVLHGLSAMIYRSAVLKVLRRGTITRQELHPVLNRWVTDLKLDVIPRAETVGLGWWARLTTRWAYRRVLFVVLFFVWLTFLFPLFYTGYFLVSDPFKGFLNHPMIQAPCFDFIPPHLWTGRDDAL